MTLLTTMLIRILKEFRQIRRKTFYLKPTSVAVPIIIRRPDQQNWIVTTPLADGMQMQLLHKHIPLLPCQVMIWRFMPSGMHHPILSILLTRMVLHSWKIVRQSKSIRRPRIQEPLKRLVIHSMVGIQQQTEILFSTGMLKSRLIPPYMLIGQEIHWVIPFTMWMKMMIQLRTIRS